MTCRRHKSAVVRRDIDAGATVELRRQGWERIIEDEGKMVRKQCWHGGTYDIACHQALSQDVVKSASSEVCDTASIP